MANAAQFPFATAGSIQRSAGVLPFLPLKLSHQNRIVSVQALLDTGASINVLPHNIGLQLGAVWEHQSTVVPLTGNLSNCEARALIVSAGVASFPEVPLIFAWTETDSIPLILGQANFFMEFDVCFFRSRGLFEVKPK